MNSLKWLTLVPCLGLIAGCSKHDGLERAPITGILTVQGTPLPGATVLFIPVQGSQTQGAGAIGTSGPDGKFQVVSSRQDDAGIPPGEYSVAVSRLADPDGTILSPEATQADHPSARETVPAPYSGHASPLKVTIPKEGGEIKVDVPAKLIERKPKS
jgi:hypothetical protein